MSSHESDEKIGSAESMNGGGSKQSDARNVQQSEDAVGSALRTDADSIQTTEGVPRKRQHSDSTTRLSTGKQGITHPSLADKAAMNALDRMALAHAITLDESFEVKQRESVPRTVEAQIESTVRRAFWDSFRSRIESVPHDYSLVLSCILEAKEALLSFLPAPVTHSSGNGNDSENTDIKKVHHDLRERIERELSRSWLERQIASNAIDLSHYADLLLRFMAELCAPVRDEELERARDENDVAEKYRMIFETLDHMKVDFANFHIRAVRPMLKRISHEYERDKFDTYQKALATSSSQVEQKDAFTNTAAWLRRAATQLLLEHQQTASAVDQEIVSTAGDWIVSPTAVLFNAFVNLIDEVHEPSEATAADDRTNNSLIKQYASYPETLALDFEHLVACRLRFHDLALLSAVLVTVMNNPGALRYISHENTLLTETAGRKESSRTPPANTSGGDTAENKSSATKQMQLLFVDTLKSEIDLVIHDASAIASTSPENKTSRDLFVLERVADFLIYRFTRRSHDNTNAKASKRAKQSPDADSASGQSGVGDNSKASTGDVIKFFDEEDIDLLRAQILSLESANNAVRKLITSRLRRYFINLLQHLYAVPATSRPSSASSPASATPTSSGSQNLADVKIPAGFQPLAVDVERLASVYMRLIAHNQATFGKDYARLIRTIGDELGLQRKPPASTSGEQNVNKAESAAPEVGTSK